MLDLNSIQSQAGIKLSFANPAQLISNLLPFVFGGAGIALLIYMVFGGFQLMLSKGDPKAIQSAQGKITNALIGFIIVVVAYSLVRLFGQLFGIQNTLFGQIFK